ncbi:MAG: Do family serine endopeptidase [Candidatus Omnitrophota bacterium]
MKKLGNKIIWLGVFILGVSAGIIFMKGDMLPKAAAVILSQEENISQSAPPVAPNAFNIENAVVNVANLVGKAVVSISTVHTEKVSASGYRRFSFGTPFGEEPGSDPFRKFFDDFFDNLPEREFKQMGLGSGVIIDKEGYILTNEHVIDEADKITVTLSDGREFVGEIKGKDPRADLAVIKINARNLPAAKLGDSSEVKIGQWAVAIGNPFGFAIHNPEPTVTVGVISALHRSLGRGLSRDKDFNDLIQTDAAINPGNSGGPLVNLKGEVIGINVAIFSTSGGYEGIGFAIPSNTAKKILNRLIEGKKILYGWLGVTVQDLDEKLSAYFGLPEKSGVLVNEAIVGGPAEKGGLKSGDIIRSFDGEKISSVRELLSKVNNVEVGKEVKLGVWRDKKDLEVVAKVVERPEDLGSSTEKKAPNAAGNWRGISVKDIDENIKQQLGLGESEGVVVVDIEPDSAASEAGIIVGDIIDELNRTKVKDVSDFERISKNLKGDVLVRTNRGYIVVKE